MTNLGVIFPPDQPPDNLRAVALAAERAGLDQLWLWEDCFKESGIATAAAVLGWTSRLRVGIGLLPVPLRNVALTAMELATLERLFPGRLLPGLGHGVSDWMAQVGGLVDSPMTLLREYAAALRSLLAGEEVTTQGRYLKLDKVKLDWPPSIPPPLYIGGVRRRTVTLAGELGDGVILTGDTSLADMAAATTWLREGRRMAGRDGAPDAVVFIPIVDRPEAEEIAQIVGEFAERGATHVALLSVGDDKPVLTEFAHFIGTEVQPLVG